MKLAKDTMLDLMAYADGELDGDDKKRVEALLASSEDARRVVEGMTGLGVIVGRIYQAPAASLSDGIVDHVMDRVEKARASERGGEKVDEPRRPSVRPAKILDLRAEREKRVKLGGAVIAIVALAAGIVLTTRHANQQAPVAKGPATPTTTQEQAPPGPPPTAPVAPHDEMAAAAGVDVEQVDSNRDVQVYYLPSSVRANASSVVVWIDDKGTAP